MWGFCKSNCFHDTKGTGCYSGLQGTQLSHLQPKDSKGCWGVTAKPSSALSAWDKWQLPGEPAPPAVWQHPHTCTTTANSTFSSRDCRNSSHRKLALGWGWDLAALSLCSLPRGIAWQGQFPFWRLTLMVQNSHLHRGLCSWMFVI